MVERQFLAELDRAVRSMTDHVGPARTGRGALILHLSRMQPPAPRSHHCRIARAILDDAAHALEGQVFSMRNMDIVLLFRRPLGVQTLQAQLAQLFRADAPDPALLQSLFTLADDAAALRDYAAARLRDEASSIPVEPQGSARTIDALEEVVEGTPLTNLLRRQTAMLIRAAAGSPITPLYRQITFNVAVLEARVAALGQAHADPFLFRHLASRLDARMLTALRQDMREGGPLTRFTAGPGLPLHLNVTVQGVLSPEFAAFAATCRGMAAEIGVEIALIEACGDPAGFALARERLRMAGLRLVLDGVSHHALLLTLPSVLHPDLVKLYWSEQIPECGQTVPAALDRIGLNRVVLDGADSEAALSWGLAHGIRRFQGASAERLLAAERLRSCPAAAACTMRQCQERASATGPGGRAGCGNPVLLDRGISSLATDMAVLA